MASFDAAALLNEYGDDTFVRELAGLLIDVVPAQVDAIQRAVAASDARALCAACHRLRGSIAAFGVPAVVDMLRSLEAIGTTRNLAGAHTLATSLAGDVHALCDDARAWLLQSGGAP